MPSFSWVASLTEAAFLRGWLTRAAQQKVQVLVEQGLHPEQALLGTGLLSVEQYADAAQSCWNIAPIRLDVDAQRVVLPPKDDGRSIGIEDEEGKRWYVVADLWETDAKAPKGYALLATFVADIERLTRRDEALDLATSEWLDAVEATKSHDLRLGVEHGHGEVLLGTGDHVQESLAVEREEVPALQAWLVHGYGSSHWDARLRAGLESYWAEAVARHQPHPLQRMPAWQERIQDAYGVLVVVDPDHWTLRHLESVPIAQAFHELLATEHRKRVFPRTDAEREEALHAALAGAALCWIEESDENLSFFRQLARLGIPVTMVRHRLTPHGSAWEAYCISL